MSYKIGGFEFEVIGLRLYMLFGVSSCAMQ